MNVAKKAKMIAEVLASGAYILQKEMQELAGLAEEFTPADYKALRKAERMFLAFHREVLGILHGIKGKREDNSMEAVKRFLEEI